MRARQGEEGGRAPKVTQGLRPPVEGSPRLCLLGAPGDTGNLGVTALLHAIVAGLAERLPRADVTVFDNSFGVREGAWPAPEGEGRLRYVGLRVSRRLHRPESLARIRLSSRLGGLDNPAARALAAADAVLDISGGDSFSDIYPRRWQRLTVEPKRLVVRLGRPLLLLPQMYGPFSADRARREAVTLLRAADAAWARDPYGYSQLQELLGSAFTPSRHHAGVDVAFRLPPTPPARGLAPDLADWLHPHRSIRVVGLNVSGLLYNQPDAATRFGLAVDYPAMVRAFVLRLLDESEANIVLLPHVVGAGAESDQKAGTHLLNTLPPEHRGRVATAPAMSSPGEMKWLISRLDWFCGTRMHSTIAALSSGVPACVVAYSPKARGVFDTCGLTSEVVDARHLDNSTAVGLLVDSWRRRAETRQRLGTRLPATLQRADEQMDAIAERIRALAGARSGTPSASR